MPPLSRRLFLTGLSALGLAACAGGTQADTPIGHLVVGHGPETVVVLHEWLGDHGNYDAAIPYLSPATARYVFADLRGYGLSRDRAGAYSLTEAAADVLALMDRLGQTRFHVVGHSMSGMIAQYLAATRPDRVKSVVLVSPVPASGFKADAAAMAKLRAVVTDDDALRAAIKVRTGGRYGDGWLERKVAIARRARNEAMMGYLDMFTGSDFAERMTGLAVPALLLTGANDIPFYRREALEPLLRPAFTRLEVAVAADAGHYSMIETPVLWSALVERAVRAAA